MSCVQDPPCDFCAGVRARVAAVIAAREEPVEADDAFERGVRWQQERDKGAHDPEPEAKSVTVTLPERILGRPWTVVELRMLAEWADNAGSGEAGAVLGHVADALDAATTPPAPPADQED